MKQLRLTETILMLIVIVVALFAFNCVFKPALDGMIKQAVKPVSLKSVRL